MIYSIYTHRSVGREYIALHDAKNTERGVWSRGGVSARAPDTFKDEEEEDDDDGIDEPDATSELSVPGLTASEDPELKGNAFFWLPLLYHYYFHYHYR